jgi:predicted DNA-binding protein
MEKKAMSFKLPPELLRRLRSAASGHYAPTMTAIVERGIELALRELEKKSAK